MHTIFLHLDWYDIVYGIWPLAALYCWIVGERIQFKGSTENVVEQYQYFASVSPYRQYGAVERFFLVVIHIHYVLV